MNPADTDMSSEEIKPQHLLPGPVIVGIVVIILFVGAGALLALASPGSRAIVPVLLLLGGVLVVGLVLLLAWRQEGKRRDAVAAALRRLGLSFTLKPDEAGRAAAIDLVPHLKGLRTGARGIQWAAGGEADGLPIDAFEHKYVIHAGNSTRVVFHTVFSTPCPASWPRLTLAPENFFHKIGELLGLRDLQVEDEGFNRRWRVKSDSEEFAIVLLTPQVQQWLMGAPKGEAWQIGHSRLCWIRQGRIRPDEAAPIIQRIGEFTRALPPELAAWEGPAHGA